MKKEKIIIKLKNCLPILQPPMNGNALSGKQ